MSGGLTPCRQLRPSSRREHVNASRNHKLFMKACAAQLLSRKLKSFLAWLNGKVGGRGCAFVLRAGFKRDISPFVCRLVRELQQLAQLP